MPLLGGFGSPVHAVAVVTEELLRPTDLHDAGNGSPIDRSEESIHITQASRSYTPAEMVRCPAFWMLYCGTPDEQIAARYARRRARNGNSHGIRNANFLISSAYAGCRVHLQRVCGDIHVGVLEVVRAGARRRAHHERHFPRQGRGSRVLVQRPQQNGLGAFGRQACFLDPFAAFGHELASLAFWIIPQPRPSWVSAQYSIGTHSTPFKRQSKYFVTCATKQFLVD
jgi:hypothetical protein